MARKTLLTCVLGFVCSLSLAAVAAAQPLAVPIPQQLDRLLPAPATIPATAVTDGMWSPVESWPLIAMHTAVTPDGKVVTYGSQVNSFDIFGVTFDIWNPHRGWDPLGHRQVSNPARPGGDPNVKFDSFCSAPVLLKTGQLMVSGGNTGAFDSPAHPTFNTTTSLVDAVRNSATLGSSMASPRYYATTTVLSDGRVLITGGTYAGGPATLAFDSLHGDSPANHLTQMSATPEVYTPGSGWSSLMGATSLDGTGGDNDAFGPRDNRWWYPRQWLAPDGTVFGISARRMWYLNPAGTGSTTLLSQHFTTDDFGAVSRPNIGATSTAVMYDVGKILQVGGNGRMNAVKAGSDLGPLDYDWTDSSYLATVVDINTPGTATLTPVPHMNFYRQWANSTVLPDGKVLVTGGTSKGDSSDPGDPVHAAETWNPGDLSWMIGASAAVTRVYHSTALLLPDGAVLTAGSGGPPGWHTPNPGQQNAEVYFPRYLFQASGASAVLAPRPRILSILARKFAHGDTIVAEISAGDTISKVALIGLGATTHGFDMGQRLYPAPFTQTFSATTSRVWLTVPAATLTPPGYYYLFVTNLNGVPSEGVIIAIGSDVAPPPNPRAVLDFDADRITDLAMWDPTTANWYIRKSADGSSVIYTFSSPPVAGDIPHVADFDGDGKADLVIWRLVSGVGHWLMLFSGSNYTTTADLLWGSQGMLPVAADYDGDGVADLAMYDPSSGIWYIRQSSNGSGVQRTVGGLAGDIPRPDDYDGDGKVDPAVWRVVSGVGHWLILLSTSGYTTTADLAYGSPGMIPAPADYDGDGIGDIALYDPSSGTWYIRNSSDGSSVQRNIGVGSTAADIPRPGDFDGDGKADPAIWRVVSGVGHWYVLFSGSNYTTSWDAAYGSPGMIPVSINYNY